MFDSIKEASEYWRDLWEREKEQETKGLRGWKRLDVR